MAEKKVAIIVGVGEGLGSSLVQEFAMENYSVLAAARSLERLQSITSAINNSGGRAHPFVCDSTNEASVEKLFDFSIDEVGDPSVVIYNAGSYIPNDFLNTTSLEFQACWNIGCLGGFHVGQAAARHMVKKGEGTIIFTGATAACRGSAGFHNLAVPKFGLRALSQSMARELGPKGIHVAHVVIDGIISSKMNGSADSNFGESKFLNPDSIAKSYLMLHKQSRDAWTLELDLRPWVEIF